MLNKVLLVLVVLLAGATGYLGYRTLQLESDLEDHQELTERNWRRAGEELSKRATVQQANQVLEVAQRAQAEADAADRSASIAGDRADEAYSLADEAYGYADEAYNLARRR